MKERKGNLSQIGVKFKLDIIYAFGSHAREVFEWMEGKSHTLSISSLSDVDIGVKGSVQGEESP